MRGTNGPMDVITRAEFDDSMKDVLTKTDFEVRLADTKNELVAAMKETIRENLRDLKVDLFAEVETKVTKSYNYLTLDIVKRSHLNDAKNEILATTRRNISEAISEAVAPLATKAELEGVKSEMENGFLKMASRLDAMDEKINGVMDRYSSFDESMKGLTQEVRKTLENHEKRLDRHDADLYELRQSGVLQ
jgi:hypothetical protein